MSPPPSFYLQPEHEHRRRTRTQTHDSCTRSSSLASTLRSPTTNINVDSLGKPQLTNQTQHRPHQSHHSRGPSHFTRHTPSKPKSLFRSSSTFPSTISLTSAHPSAPNRLPLSPPYSTFSPANVSRASTLISTQPPPIALAFLNLLDDLGILLLCKPLLELCNVEWISLFDDMGIFYLCEPIEAIRRALRKRKIGRVDRQRGGGSCLGSMSSKTSKSSKSSKDTWERDTVSWISSLVSEMRKSKSSGSSGSSESKKHSTSGRRSRERERQSERDMMKNKSADSVSGIGSESKNGSISGIGSGCRSKNGSVSGIGGGSMNASERISGTNRRRNERAASSIAASHIGQSLKGIRKEKHIY
ncbi:74513b46-0f8a-44d8-bf6b-c9d301cbb132 [Sclerotinia trifoliorum]|uniref:74513b46-0f8a-44d8-bf6b-c9d301cbb132 n=1 Tax=Sclerotinia trifoliorum TaxID=28548 RepID=A0A8H2VSG6_9HELO|nr:74513b46-0f8a-44d8-bf6b-c9d301cbb132 [Sclerotinia trifoliorum]